jgi:hypothetical protein
MQHCTNIKTERLFMNERSLISDRDTRYERSLVELPLRRARRRKRAGPTAIPSLESVTRPDRDSCHNCGKNGNVLPRQWRRCQ